MVEIEDLTFRDYQRKAARTAIYPKSAKLTYPALGLASEAGEVAGKVKKLLRDGELDPLALADELGDVLWYVAALAADLGYDLDAIAERNLEKLQSRSERGTIGGNGDNR